jgi:hypothetical protein
MGVIGGAGGFATVNPTQGNPIMEGMQNAENSAFKYNAQRIADEKLKQDAIQSGRDLKDKRLKEDIDYATKHKITPTSVSSVNKAQLDFSVDNQNMYNKSKDIVRDSSDPEERRAAMETMINLESSFEIAKALPEMINASAKDLEEGVRTGKYNPLSSKNAAETIEAMEAGNIKTVYKPNGIPTFITYKRDGEGNLTEIIDKELTLAQLKQKLSPIMAFDLEANNAEFKKALPPISEWESADGKKVIKGYQGIEGYAEDNANSVVTNRDKMYGIASAAGIKPQLDLKDYSESDIKKVKAFIVDGFKEKYKSAETNNYTKLTLENKIKQDEINNNNEQIRIKIAKDAAGKENKEIRFTVKDGLLGRETSATMKMSDQEYADYLAKNGVTDVKTMDEVWNDPINAGYAKATKNSPEKTKISKGQVVDGYKYLGGDTKNAKSWKKI